VGKNLKCLLFHGTGKESRESKHWLRMIVVACPELKEEARPLWTEAKELNLIFNAIVCSSKKKK